MPCGAAVVTHGHSVLGGSGKRSESGKSGQARIKIMRLAILKNWCEGGRVRVAARVLRLSVLGNIVAAKQDGEKKLPGKLCSCGRGGDVTQDANKGTPGFEPGTC